MTVHALVLLLALPVAGLGAWDSLRVGPFTEFSDGLLAEVKLPLPDAPVRIVIPDVAAFDSALGGAYRNAFLGTPEAGDPVMKAWRQSRLGAKLEDQWGKFAHDLPWTWQDIRALRPRAIGFALLDAGQLEAVMVIETSLAALSVALPAGTARSHRGVSYSLVAPGAADGAIDTDRRPGLAWARMGERLLVASSERALLLTIDEAQAGRGLAPPLPGLVSMELDLTALRRDLYFRREFLFTEGQETGKLRAALRLEGDQMVEIREGTGESRTSAFRFDAPAAAAAGWEPAGHPFWPALRAGLLEPVPNASDKPVPSLVPLPPATRQAAEDRYAVNFTRPLVVPGAPPWEQGDLARWKTLFDKQPVTSWGYWLDVDGVRRVVFPWPVARDGELLELCRATVARRAGRATVVAVGDAREIRVGPDLVALAIRRTASFVWIGPSARDLAMVPAPGPTTDLVRWARVDLAAVREQRPRWARIEGPAQPEYVRSFFGRLVGLLDWMPATTSLLVERRKTASGWTERVVFGVGGR